MRSLLGWISIFIRFFHKKKVCVRIEYARLIVVVRICYLDEAKIMHGPNVGYGNNIRLDLFLEIWRKTDATHVLKWNMYQFCATIVIDLQFRPK